MKWRRPGKVRELFKTEGEYIVFIQTVPLHRICVRGCKNHRIEIKGRFLLLICEPIIGRQREWAYELSDTFREGCLIIYLNEGNFNKLMIKLSVGIFSLYSKKRVEVNNKFFVPITSYTLERRY